MKTNRRQFLGFSAVSVAGSVAATSVADWLCVNDPPELSGPPEPQEEKKKPELQWQDAHQLTVEGVGFPECQESLDRLPPAAKDDVRPDVWNLSRTSSGVIIRFATDSQAIHVKYSLLNNQMAMPHMPATSVSGLDLYADDGTGKTRWAAVLKPSSTTIDSRLINNIKPMEGGGPRNFELYLPLYNKAVDLSIGVSKGATLSPSAPRTEKPIVFYGTSIMHGACASRPGMSISSILRRRLDRPVINLGFSGNGRMELEVGKYLCKLDPGVYAIDCLPNLGPKQVAERTVPLVRQLREARPETPILLVEDRVFTNAWIMKGKENFHAANRKALLDSFNQLQSDGVSNLHYLKHDDLMGDDHEGATDGSHPSDLGMVRYADAYEPVLRKIMG